MKMSDTNLQNCNCCDIETDCIEGLCDLCSDYNYKLQKKHDTLKDENQQLQDRLRAMYAGDLSPESRLSGYKVITRALEKRRDELLTELGEIRNK